MILGTLRKIDFFFPYLVSKRTLISEPVAVIANVASIAKK